MTNPGGNLDSLFTRIDAGDGEAAGELFTHLYDDLHRLAKVRLRRFKPYESIQTTELLHQAYVQLMGSRNRDWKHRRYFFGAASRAMWNLLVDRARQRNGREFVPLDHVRIPIAENAGDIFAVDQALDALDRDDPRAADVVRLRLVAGLRVSEVASLLEVSRRTVERDWTYARAFLAVRLRP